MGFNRAPDIITIPTQEHGDLQAVRMHLIDGPFSFLMRLTRGPLVEGTQATAIEIMRRPHYADALAAAAIYAAERKLPSVTLTYSDEQMAFLHFSPLADITPLSREFVLEHTPNHTLKRP